MSVDGGESQAGRVTGRQAACNAPVEPEKELTQANDNTEINLEYTVLKLPKIAVFHTG